MHQQLVAYPGWYGSEALMHGKVPCLIVYGFGVVLLPIHLPIVVIILDYLANPKIISRNLQFDYYIFIRVTPRYL